MGYQVIDGVRVWGDPLENAVSQAVTCGQHGNVVQSLLMADHHKGYSQPIGGVVVYDGQISPSGVGYDIACGNKAVRTELTIHDIGPFMGIIMDKVAKQVSFGVGRTNAARIEHELFDRPEWDVYKEIGKQEHDKLFSLAREQLGTVGSGNHYVDILYDLADGRIWIANHFGSRGFGHKTASGFLNLAAGRKFFDKAPGESMDQPPTLLDLDTDLGRAYFECMNLAGAYAYAGRDYVIQQVLDILGTKADIEVHNHHNFAWKEVHGGKEVVVVRKGATPLHPGQVSFIGGSMTDISVIVEGVDSQETRDSFNSTVHGAGRIMSRTEAAGKVNWKSKGKERMGGKITPEMMREAVEAAGVTLRGAGTDESPFVYKQLKDVLEAHSGTMNIKHTLRPLGVAMAGGDEFDPYKD